MLPIPAGWTATGFPYAAQGHINSHHSPYSNHGNCHGDHVDMRLIALGYPV